VGGVRGVTTNMTKYVYDVVAVGHH